MKIELSIAWFVPVVKQLRKYTIQLCELFVAWSDQQYLLLHKSWAEFYAQKDSVSDYS